MSIGLITITHNHIGEEILSAARQIVGRSPIPIRCVDVSSGEDPAVLRQTLHAIIAEIDSGDGVLILTDLYGATPCNVACDSGPDHAVRIVAGINLAMVLSVLNYAHLDLERVAGRAAVGGQRGIVESRGRDNH